MSLGAARSDSAGPPSPAERPDRPRSVVVSVVAGIALACVVIGALVAGPSAFFVFGAAVILIAQAELYAVLRTSGQSPAALVGLVCGGMLLVGTYARGAIALPLMAALPVPLLMVWALTVPAQRARSTLVSTYIGIVYGPVFGGFMVLLLAGKDGRVLVPAFIGMTAIMDSAAYLIGRKIGRHRMTPRISPGKSWEGLIAGTIVSVGLSVAILPFLHPFTPLLALKLSLVMCAVAPFGDLAESLVKRDLGVKDMGSLLPGHGGLFDRIDAPLFAAPVAYFVLHVLGWAH